MKTGVFTVESIFSFVDNHDVSRIATILEDKQQLPVIYGLLFGMPGVPSIYYGSEWGIEGKNRDVMKRFVLVLKNRNGMNFLMQLPLMRKHTTLTRLYTTVAMRIFL